MKQFEESLFCVRDLSEVSPKSVVFPRAFHLLLFFTSSSRAFYLLQLLTSSVRVFTCYNFWRQVPALFTCYIFLVSIRSHRPYSLSPLMKFTQGRTVFCCYITLRWSFSRKCLWKCKSLQFERKKIVTKDSRIRTHDPDSSVYYANH